MSYLDRTHDPRRHTAAIMAVGIIHAGLGYLLVTGLGGAIMERLPQPPLRGTQIPLTPVPPPPPAPEPSPAQIQPSAQRPMAPTPPITLPSPPGPMVDVFDPMLPSVTEPLVQSGPIPSYTPEPPRPAPSFTPRAARPSNNEARWITNDDYPRRPLLDGAEGVTRYRVTVDTNGRVSDCQVTGSSGHAQLDSATCRLISSRARFEAATDETGAKIAGTYTGSVRWQIPR
jgi:periplasmic protein TonB